MSGGGSSSSSAPKGGDDTVVERADASLHATPVASATPSPREAYLELAGLPDVILPGTLLGRYVVLEVVGRGGMGTVVRAYDPRLRREVAVKRLRPRAGLEQAEARLVREARAMAQLSHPNVVAVYDVEAVPWGVLVAMEYVRGSTLREWLREPRSRREILDAFRQAGAGLAAAHAAGLVHRDVKPANVLVEEPPGSRVRVTDFGLARGIEAGEPAVSIDSGEDVLDAVDPPSGDPLTLAGVVLGTPLYMAPEQHVGETAGPAADQYSFCIALWEALTRTRPFDAEDHEALARMKVQGPPPWPRQHDVPARVSQAIRRGLAPDPRDRFATMTELVDALADDPVRAARRRAFAAAAVIAAASAAFAIAGSRSAGRDLCTGADERLAEVWNPERRASAEAAMLATKQVYAADAWAAVAPALDEWGAAWTRMHTDTCEATAVRGEQSAAVLDLRMTCLQRAHGQLRSVTDMLVSADAEVVLHAHTLVDGLPDLERCADVVALQGDVPAPSDPAVAAEVDSIRDRIADASALTRAGKAAVALDRIGELIASSTALDHTPLAIDLALAHGQALMALGRFAEAEAVLREALRSALEIGELRDAAWLASGLTLVVGDRLGRAAEGLAFADVAVALAEGDAGDSATIASARNNLANVFLHQGRHAEAEAEHRRVLATRIAAHGEHHYDVATSRLNLGNVLTSEGKLDEAEVEIGLALAILRERLGDEHPEVAVAHSSFGGVVMSAGRFTEAEASFREALRIRLAAFGPENVQVAEARGNLGNVLQSLGRLDEAEEELRATVIGIESALGREHPHAAIAHSNLGSFLQATGRIADAVAEYRLAFETAARALGREHPLTLTFRHNLAGARSDAGELEDAESELREVAKLRRVALGPDHPDVARTHVALGTTLLQRGRLVEAEASYREGVATWERAVGPDHLEIANAWIGLAQAIARQDRDADAIQPAQRAYDLRHSQQTTAGPRAEAAFTLAKVLWSTPSQRERALELAREARDEYAKETSDRADPPRREVARWLSSPTPHERGAP